MKIETLDSLSCSVDNNCKRLMKEPDVQATKPMSNIRYDDVQLFKMDDCRNIYAWYGKRVGWTRLSEFMKIRK